MSTRLDEIVDELYAGAPDAFVTARDAAVRAARQDGDRELAAQVRALRRPSAAASLINKLARSDADPGLVQLADLGARLRQAQSDLSGAEMKALGAERNSLVRVLVDAAVGDTGASGPVRDQVTATLTAAVADPAAERAVCSGRLVTALQYSGLGEVDISAATATALPTSSPTASAASSSTADAALAREIRAARTALERARSRQHAAETARQTAERVARAAAEALDAATASAAKAAEDTAAAQTELAQLLQAAD
ncbi:hypothetical protein [Rudaeicoccus suwonensis]|uniref:Uncharacterized protein n=1 Tax=Rudaeicoccus suwonensis TaxID=657409 RepID=A0A561E3F8_9MICO|nr:hypothetical protein [Rudaeicoccus suwonensis]TWE10148.1 hypothetical protein BKA23_2500 [Rudaeicoccus suwonensis]